MPKDANAYFGQYPSPSPYLNIPNHTIVPTVYSCHPPPLTGWGQIADPLSSNPTINCEQIAPLYIAQPPYTPYVSNCNQQNFQFMNTEAFFNSTSTPEFSENFQNPPLIYQNPISPQASSIDMSRSIKEQTVSKYKSHNNLVDLTGFNILKRDSASPLTKSQDLKHIDETKTEPNETIISSEKEPRHCFSNTSRTDKLTKEKESAKNMDSIISNGLGSSEHHAYGKFKENTKGNMKNYFRELFNRNYEKFKDKAAREKLSSCSSKKRQEFTESKHEFSKSTAEEKTSSERNYSRSTNDFRNKITEGSKRYRDLERRFAAEYPNREKYEQDSRNLQHSKVSVRDRKIGLSPGAIQRYEDFQRFLRRYNDNEIKYKREDQLKTKSLPRKKIRTESRETTNVKRKIDVKKKIDELKQYLQLEKLSKLNTIQSSLEKDKTNTNIEKARENKTNTYTEKALDQTEKSKAINKSIKQGDQNLPYKHSQRETVERVQDLRSKLSRKRSSSDCFEHNQESTDNKLDRKSLVKSKNSPILAPSVDEPKAKKSKPIEFIKNKKSPDVETGRENLPILASPVDELKAKKSKPIELNKNKKSPNVETGRENSPILAPPVDELKAKKSQPIELIKNKKSLDMDACAENSPILASPVVKLEAKKYKLTEFIKNKKSPDVEAGRENSPILVPPLDALKAKKSKPKISKPNSLDVDAGSENSPILASTVDKPKAKKSKPIELIKNKKSPDVETSRENAPILAPPNDELKAKKSQPIELIKNKKNLDVDAGSENSPILASTVDKLEAKKYKPIELIKNKKIPDVEAGRENSPILVPPLDTLKAKKSKPKSLDVEAGSENSPILASTVDKLKDKKSKPIEFIKNKKSLDVDAGSENSPILASTVDKLKAKISKPIDLIKNKKCPDVEAGPENSPILASPADKLEAKKYKPIEIIKNKKGPDVEADRENSLILAPPLDELKTKKPNPESLDVEAGSENSPILASTVDKLKAKKSKPIELIKSVKNSGPDPVDIDQDPPEDLTFLDDLIIHADEIVASLPSSSKFENPLCSSITMSSTDNTKSELIKKISANSIKDNENTNPEESLNNDDNMEPIKINKTNGYYLNNEETRSKEDLNNYGIHVKTIEITVGEERSLHKMVQNCYKEINYSKIKNETKPREGLINNLRVKEINSDLGGQHFEIGSNANEKKQDEKNMGQNDRICQHEENNNTDIIEKVYEEIEPKETMRFSKVEQKIIITINAIKSKKPANNIENVSLKHYEKNTPKETTSLCKAEQNIATGSYDENVIMKKAKNVAHLTEKANKEVVSKEIPTDSNTIIHINEEANNMASLSVVKTYEENAIKETASLCKAQQKITVSSYKIDMNEDTNNMTDFTVRAIKENVQKEIASICRAKKIITMDSNSEIHIQEEADIMEDLCEKANGEIAPKETSPCVAKQEITTDSNDDLHINEEANNMTALTGKQYEENAEKETSPCNMKHKITADSNNQIHMAEETEKVFEEYAPMEADSLCKTKQNIKTHSYDEIHINEHAKNMADYDENAPKETTSPYKDTQGITTDNSDEIHNMNEDANNMADLTVNDCEENSSLSKTIQKTDSKYEVNIIQESKDVTDLTVNDYEEMAPKNTRRLCKTKRQNIKINSNTNKNQKHANYITDLTGNNLRVEVCDDSDDSVIEVIDITDENEHDKISKNLQPNVNRHFGSNTKALSRKEDGERPQDTTRNTERLLEKQVTQNSSNTDKKQTQFHKSADPIETSLQSKDIIKSNNSINNFSDKSDVFQQVNTLVKNVKDNNDNSQHPKDIIEASLETMFNNSDQNGCILNHIEEDVLKTAQTTGPETIINILDTTDNEKVEPSFVDKHIIIETEVQGNPTLEETTKNSIEQNVAVEIDTSPLNVSDIQENLPQKSEIDTSSICRSDKPFQEQVQTLKYSSDINTKKPNNAIEKNNQDVSANSAETPEVEKKEVVNSSLAQKNEEESETLSISKETVQTSSETTITTPKLEQKAKSNKSEKTPISCSNLISEGSQENLNKRCSRSEATTPVTNTKKVTNKSLVQSGRRNKDDNSSLYFENPEESQLSPKPRHYILKLELQMSEYLLEDYIISSVIHVGRFSTIYKCIDPEGRAHALKVVRQRMKGVFLEGIFNHVQRYTRQQDSCILYLMNAFQFQDRWCLLTEYFPRNLEQALNENNRGFHIDHVQLLTRQLVSAVKMLASANIIHSDIKQTHILLNRSQDRLKLCGFDRASYCNAMKITPSSGSPKYRAPEVILGFQPYHKVDVWCTGLIIFEMATNKSLFNELFNNGLLYEQLCTLGSFDWTMVDRCRYRDLYFSGYSFTRRVGPQGQNIIILDSLERNDNLREMLFESYNQYWAQDKSKWQITKEMDKLETLHALLEQMLALDPRNRLPIHYVNASEFMNHTIMTA